ncbi:MAG: MBL fold metallo-hydrolase [Waddliaceae bacterium]
MFPSGPLATNAYVVSCSETHEAAIVDPAPDSSTAIISYINKNVLKPTHMLITHSHWDHIGDAAQLKEAFHLPVLIHALDVPNLQKPGTDGLPGMLPIKGVEADKLLCEGDIVSVGSKRLEVIHTPGHTPGGVCFYCKEEGILLSGDTLFKGSIGNLSFPTADPRKMWSSLEKLAILPPDTKVYPGHGPKTTIGEEHWLPRAKELFGGYT